MVLDNLMELMHICALALSSLFITGVCSNWLVVDCGSLVGERAIAMVVEKIADLQLHLRLGLYCYVWFLGKDKNHLHLLLSGLSLHYLY